MTIVVMQPLIRQSWSPVWIVGPAIGIIFSLFRSWAPSPPPNTRYDKLQAKEPFPVGVVGAMMWGVGICLAATFFLLQWINHAWAQLDGPAVIRLYPPSVIWGFFPGFAALTIPWPLVVWWLRRQGRTDEADEANQDSSSKVGFDSYTIMKWMSIGLVGPIFIFTVLALPKHLSISHSEARVVPYASLVPKVFRFDRATHAFLVEETYRSDGSSTLLRDLYIDFPNGRLDANAEGDGGTSADEDVIRFLLSNTKLQPIMLHSKEELPPVSDQLR